MEWSREISFRLIQFIFSTAVVADKYLIIRDTIPDLEPGKNTIADCLVFIVSRRSSLPFKPLIQIQIEMESTIFEQNAKFTIEQFLESQSSLVGDEIDESFKVNFRFLFVDSIKSLDYLIKIQRKQQEQEQYYLIILPETTSNFKQLLEQMFLYFWRNSLFNVYVLKADSNETVTLFTYDPFTKTSCRDLNPKVHNRFINGKWESKKPLFLPKTKNLWKCPITVIIWRHKLYVHPDRLCSREQTMLERLASDMNFSIKYLILPDGGRGEIYKNYTTTKSFKMLSDKRGDLLMGVWCSNEGNHLFEPVEYGFDHEIIIFKRTETYLPLEILLFPFDLCTWTLLLTFVFCKFMIEKIYKFFENSTNKDSRTYKKNLYRSLIIVCTLSSLILRSSYEGSVFKFLHNKPEKALPKNVNEAVNRGYKFIVSEKEIYDIPDLKQHMIATGVLEMLNTFNRLDGNIAWLYSEKQLASFNRQGRNYLVAENPLLSTLQCMYVQKFSFLSNEIKKHLSMMVTYGYNEKILKMSKPMTYMQRTQDTTHRQISLYHLLGVFQLFFALILASWCVLCMEILSKYCKTLKTFLDIFQ